MQSLVTKDTMVWASKIVNETIRDQFTFEASNDKFVNFDNRYFRIISNLAIERDGIARSFSSFLA